jgi:hypothetical protein
MPGRSAEARNQAIQAQGVAEALLKRIKAREREIQGSVLEARSQVDRNESALRSARSDAERSDLRGRLVAARRSLQEWEEIKALSGSVVFSADTLGRVRGQINVSATNLRDDRPVPTLEAMTAAQRDAERLLALSDQIVEAVRAKLQAEAVLQGLQDLASSERVRVDTTALQAALKKASDLIAQGQYGPAKD